MANDALREAARLAYIRSFQSCTEIALHLGCSASSVYNWKRCDVHTTADWDKARRTYNLSPKELVETYAEKLRTLMAEINADPDKMTDPAIADAIAKHVKTIKSLNPKALYMGAVLDVVKTIDGYLAHKDPQLQEQLSHHWSAIQEQLRPLAESEVPL